MPTTALDKVRVLTVELIYTTGRILFLYQLCPILWTRDKNTQIILTPIVYFYHGVTAVEHRGHAAWLAVTEHKANTFVQVSFLCPKTTCKAPKLSFPRHSFVHSVRPHWLILTSDKGDYKVSHEGIILLVIFIICTIYWPYPTPQGMWVSLRRTIVEHVRLKR